MGFTPATPVAVGAMALGGILAPYILKKVRANIDNDIRKKRIIEDLALNDPLLKTVDRRQLYHWYATLCYYAPTLAQDKLTVAEVLNNFARFGKVDFNTIKMLVDTEKTVTETSKLHVDEMKGLRQTILG